MMKKIVMIGTGLLLVGGSAWAQIGTPSDNGGGNGRAGTGNVLTGDPGAGANYRTPGLDVAGDLQQAYKDYSDKKFAQAVPELQSVLRKAPNSLPAHQMLADIYLRQNKAKDAIPELEQVVRLSPKDTATRDNLGVAYMQAGDFDKAIPLYHTALAQNPKNAKIALNYAIALEQSGKHAEAAQAFDQAAVLDSTNPQPFLYAGMTYHQIGQEDKAIPALQKALTLGAQDKFSAHMILAEAYGHTGKTDLAISEYKLASLLKPDDFGAVANQGVLSQNVGRKTDAIAAYRQALTLKAPSPEAQAQVQASLAGLLAADNTDEAVTLLTQAAQNDPKNAGYESALGQTYEKQGKKDLALAAYQKALTLDAHEPEATRGLARLKQ